MRVLVFGARGQLGAEVVADLGKRGHEVTGFDRMQVDITSSKEIERAISEGRPDWVINAAAYNKVDAAEQEPMAAMEVNGVAVCHMAASCRNAGAGLLHYSTDHVFDGRKSGAYTEEDIPRPLSAYAVSKLAGELYVSVYLEKFYIVRTAGVFGPTGRSTNRGNFVELMLRMAKEGRPIRVVEDFYASPTYAPALASRSIDLLERAPFGIYHIGGGHAISWYAYALMIVAEAGIRAEVTPTNEREYHTPARRPKNSSLSNAKMEAAGLDPMPPLQDALRQYLNER